MCSDHGTTYWIFTITISHCNTDGNIRVKGYDCVASASNSFFNDISWMDLNTRRPPIPPTPTMVYTPASTWSFRCFLTSPQYCPYRIIGTPMHLSRDFSWTYIQDEDFYPTFLRAPRIRPHAPHGHSTELLVRSTQTLHNIPMNVYLGSVAIILSQESRPNPYIVWVSGVYYHFPTHNYS